MDDLQFENGHLLHKPTAYIQTGSILGKITTDTDSLNIDAHTATGDSKSKVSLVHKSSYFHDHI